MGLQASPFFGPTRHGGSRAFERLGDVKIDSPHLEIVVDPSSVISYAFGKMSTFRRHSTWFGFFKCGRMKGTDMDIEATGDRMMKPHKTQHIYIIIYIVAPPKRSDKITNSITNIVVILLFLRFLDATLGHGYPRWGGHRMCGVSLSSACSIDWERLVRSESRLEDVGEISWKHPWNYPW